MNYSNKLVAFILLSFPLIGFAQEKHSINKIGINYSVDYSYRKLDAVDPTYQPGVVWRNDLEKPKIGFNTGATFLHPFKNGIQLEGGVQYVRFGEQSDSILITTIAVEEVGKGIYINNYDYLGIPIKIGYGFALGNRIQLSVSSGISTNFFIARHYQINSNFYDGTSDIHRETYNKEKSGSQYEHVNLVSVSSIGVDIQLFSAFSIRIEPTFRYSLNPIISSPIKQRPYSAGINTTLFYRFGGKSKPVKELTP